MYNQERTSPASWLIVIIVLVGLLFGATSINAQVLNEKNVFSPETTSDYLVKDFKVKEASNKLYFKFLIVENRLDTKYTLESSSNGTDFYAVELKEGFKSPNEVPLLYCYSVDLNQVNDNTYRIRRDSPDGTSYSSAIERASTINASLSAQN